MPSATLGGFSGGATTSLYEVQPTYDALGNVIETVTTLPQGVDTQVFCYDDLARLTWAGSSGTPACSGAPTPSDTGSLAGTGASYTYDSLNRLTASPLGSYTYGGSAHADAATAIGSGGSAWSASYGYTHQRADATTGLDYYNARYYDPLAGQFTSADTTLLTSDLPPSSILLNSVSVRLEAR